MSKEKLGTPPQLNWVDLANQYAHVNGEHHTADYLSKVATAAALTLARRVGTRDHSGSETIENNDLPEIRRITTQAEVKSSFIELGRSEEDDSLLSFASLTNRVESSTIQILRKRIILPPKVALSRTSKPVIKSIEIAKFTASSKDSELQEIPEDKFIYYPGFADHRPHVSPSNNSPKDCYAIRIKRSIEFMGLIDDLCEKAGVVIDPMQVKTFNPDKPSETL